MIYCILALFVVEYEPSILRGRHLQQLKNISYLFNYIIIIFDFEQFDLQKEM